MASTPYCHLFTYCMRNLYPCTFLCYKQTLLLLAVCWPPCILTGALGSVDRVSCSAARLIGGIPKFGHVCRYMRDVLRWLPAEQRISYRIAYLVWRCLLGHAPVYLLELCCPLVL